VADRLSPRSIKSTPGIGREWLFENLTNKKMEFNITGQDNLNKENFFNPIKEKCPLAMEVFCSWIDEYKKQIKWHQYFYTFLKFHSLPFEMQMGIMFEYFRQQSVVFFTQGGSSYPEKKYLVQFLYQSFEKQESILLANQKRTEE
jgi:hypothetical protein